MPNFNLLSTVISDINDFLFAFFNPIFGAHIRFIIVNKRKKSVFFSVCTNLQICPVLQLNKIVKAGAKPTT
jgi:hypothetical protein